MRRRWIVLPLLVVAIAAAALLFSRSGIEGKLRQRVVEELSDRLGGTVELDTVRLTGHDAVVLEGLHWIPDGGPVESLAVARIELDVDGASLLDGEPRIRGVRVVEAVIGLAGVDEQPAEASGGDEVERPTQALLQRGMDLTTGDLPEALTGPLSRARSVMLPDAGMALQASRLTGVRGLGEVDALEGNAWFTADGALHGELRGALEDGVAVSGNLELVTGAPPRGTVAIEGVPLGRLTTTLPLPEGSSWQGGVADLSFTTRADEGDLAPRWDLRADVRELELTLAELGGLPLMVEARQKVRIRPEPDASRVEIEDWRWSFNGVSGTGSGRVSDLDGEPDLRLVLQLEDVPYADIAAALPEQILPPEWGIQLGGTLDLTVRVGGALHDRPAWDLGWKGDWSRLSLRSSHVGEEITSLNEPFRYSISRKDREPLERVMGPEDSHFLSLRLINPDLVAAVLVCEDATFYKHQGFDERELRKALLENLREGGSGRGGSTITQQVAKNLFLSGERTWTRKLQEALLAWRLETSLDKDRILEIYLNRAEWGPGIYGVRDAAHHYFGTSTSQLNTWECIFLATLLPSPVRYHGYFHPGGQVTPRWEENMQLALERMHHQRYLDDDEYQAAASRLLRFTSCGR